MSRSAPGDVAAVVLAGGASRRFGRDKLAEPVGAESLLATAVHGLPSGVRLVVVGPTPHPVPAELGGGRFVREEPVGGGPAAAVVAGLRAALLGPADLIAVLPGDAPLAGRAATELLGRLTDHPEAFAVVAVDPDGRDQPLQLALRRLAAEALIVAAGVSGGAGTSARGLIAVLEPPPLRHRLTRAAVFDIDTPGQLDSWRLQGSGPVQRILNAVRVLAPRSPAVVAVDGPSGAGKSTLAAALALAGDAVVIAGDDFYNPAVPGLDAAGRDRWSDAEVADRVFDWRRLRAEALVPLAEGAVARYRPYDWLAGDGRLAPVRRLGAQPLVVLEGVYAGRPELADRVDLAVCLGVDPTRRHARLASRGDDPELARFWERGERHYFTHIRRPDDFDLTLP